MSNLNVRHINSLSQTLERGRYIFLTPLLVEKKKLEHVVTTVKIFRKIFFFISRKETREDS